MFQCSRWKVSSIFLLMVGMKAVSLRAEGVALRIEIDHWPGSVPDWCRLSGLKRFTV